VLEGIKFGVFLPFYAFKDDDVSRSSLFDRVRGIVLECERLGYHSVWLDDHLMFGGSPILECWTTLSALSSVTTRIRLGTMALCNSFREPSLLAKMAATLDRVSGGRLEFGIGAGVQEDEHAAYGFPFLKASVRVERMKEAVAIIKRMWREEKVSYEGKYYRVNGAVCEPKPMQKPHPPVTIAGAGEKLTLKVTAQYADKYDWGCLPSFEAYEHKLRVLERYCREIGRDAQEIEKSCWPGGQVLVDLNEKDLGERTRQIKPKNVSMNDFKKTNLIGTPEECLRKMQPYMELGVTFFMMFFADLPSMKSMRIFAETVAKKT
jgi:F420-dependent oxidoreductase-like protein